MAERDLELEQAMPRREDYPPDDWQTEYLAWLEVIRAEEFDREQQ